MSKQYNKLAGDILAAVGGKQNVMSLRHCITRLRFVLKDEKVAKDDVLKSMDGVATVVKAQGEYMVVIGEHVHEVYEEVCAHMGVSGKDNNQVVITEKKKSLLDKALGVIRAGIGPTLNLLCACGIIKGFLVVAGLLGLPRGSGIYMLLNAAGDCLFYSMPLMVGFNVAKKFEIDPYFGLLLGAAMTYPTIQGVELDFFGYIVNATYTSSFLPIVFGLMVAIPLYKFVDAHMPKLLKGFMTPLITLLISFPLTFIVIGPLANLVGKVVTTVINFIFTISPILGAVVVGAIWQILVMFGVHGMLVSFAFYDLLAGNPSVLIAVTSIICFSVCGTLLAVTIRSKSDQLKSASGSALVSAFFGVTEPAMYGIIVPRKQILAATCIGGAAGGLAISLFGLKMFTYSGMGIFALLGLLNPEAPNVVGIGIAVAATFAAAFAVSMVVFRDDDPEAAAVSAPAAPQTIPQKAAKTPLNKRVDIVSPLNGEVKPLSACSDEAFSGEALGKGCVILPADGQVLSPCDGEVRKLFPTGHAVGLVTPDGVEILIHIGMDTIRLEGKGFTTHVKQGDTVIKGQPLITFDKAAIEAAGYKTETPVVITNTDDYLDVVETAEGPVKAGADLLAVLM